MGNAGNGGNGAIPPNGAQKRTPLNHRLFPDRMTPSIINREAKDVGHVKTM